jgi:hypothetical protein
MSENQAEFPIATMCRLLGVCPSGYHERARTDAVLVAEIRAAHAALRVEDRVTHSGAPACAGVQIGQ